MNGAAFQSTNILDVIFVADPITRSTVTCNEDFCEGGYDSDGDISPFLIQLQMKKTLNITQNILSIIWWSLKNP